MSLDAAILLSISIAMVLFPSSTIAVCDTPSLCDGTGESCVRDSDGATSECTINESAGALNLVERITTGLSDDFDEVGKIVRMNAEGTRAAVKAGTLNTGTPSAVLVYKYDSGMWVLDQEISSADIIDAGSYMVFARELEMSRCGGDVLAIGSHGRIDVLAHDGISFSRTQTITGNGGFGSSLAISADGTWLVIGAPQIDYVHLYQRGGDGQYSLVRSVTGADVGCSESRCGLGASLACDDTCTTVAVGAISEKNPFSARGSIRVFTDFTAGSNTHTRLVSQSMSTGSFGGKVALDPSGRVVTSSTFESTSYVDVYRRDGDATDFTHAQTIGSGLSRSIALGQTMQIARNGSSLLLSDPNIGYGRLYNYVRGADGTLALDATVMTPIEDPTPSDDSEWFAYSFASDASLERFLISSPRRMQGRGVVRDYTRSAQFFECV